MESDTKKLKQAWTCLFASEDQYNNSANLSEKDQFMESQGAKQSMPIFPI